MAVGYNTKRANKKALQQDSIEAVHGCPYRNEEEDTVVLRDR